MSVSHTSTAQSNVWDMQQARPDPCVHHTLSYRNQNTRKIFGLGISFMCIETGSHIEVMDARASCSSMHAVEGTWHTGIYQHIRDDLGHKTESQLYHGLINVKENQVWKERKKKVLAALSHKTKKMLWIKCPLFLMYSQSQMPLNCEGCVQDLAPGSMKKVLPTEYLCFLQLARQPKSE